MAECDANSRRTSADVHIEYEPCGSLTEEHVVTLYFTADGTPSGTFRIWADGYLTDPIAYNATVATLVTSIQTAMDATGNPRTYTAAAVGDNVQITADAVGYRRLDVVYKGTMLGVSTVQFQVDTQGAEVFVLSGEASGFNWEKTGSLIDMTSLNQRERHEVTAKEDMNFEITVFEAEQDWLYALFEDAVGVFTVWKWGKVPGSKYFSFQGLVDSVGEDYPDGEKLEITISGVRQGKMRIPFETIYEL